MECDSRYPCGDRAQQRKTHAKVAIFGGKKSEVAMFRQWVPRGCQNKAGFYRFSTKFLADL